MMESAVQHVAPKSPKRVQLGWDLVTVNTTGYDWHTFHTLPNHQWGLMPCEEASILHSLQVHLHFLYVCVSHNRTRPALMQPVELWTASRVEYGRVETGRVFKGPGCCRRDFQCFTQTQTSSLLFTFPQWDSQRSIIRRSEPTWLAHWGPRSLH